ncbi:MAG: RHS repeat-associated core domain-containing protein, partial [Proteobacteria bacterium]|nr:RHS repeat-associated core domain-containing protein [Pseudomonadota bacterium]
MVQDVAGQKTFYVYGLGLIGQEVDGEYTSYHFDYRGSTVALTDENSQLVEQYQYSPYGLLLSGDSSKTPFLFNGMYGVMTDSNNLYYMRARFYNPEIKRFVNQDILLGDIGEGQTLNRYAFVTGRPVSFVDPFGLLGEKAVSTICGIAFAEPTPLGEIACACAIGIVIYNAPSIPITRPSGFVAPDVKWPGYCSVDYLN